MNRRFTTHVRDLPDAPTWLSLVVPMAVYPLLILLIFVYRPFYDLMTSKEGGIEYLTVLCLLGGIVYGIKIVRHHRDRLPAPWLAKWFALTALAMFVFAGEEISWGQHLGLWSHEQVPESIRAVNDQDETNLHNISNALDQGPTNIIVLSTLIAFVFLPLYLYFRRETMPITNPGYWFWPTRATLPAAIGVLIIPFPKRIYEWATAEEGPLLLRHSEIHEFYVALLMTTYLVSVYTRLRSMAGQAEPAQRDTAPTG